MNKTSHRRVETLAVAVAAFMLLATGAEAVQRFPKPEFSTEYTLPETTTPAPRLRYMEAIDLAALAGAMALAAWLALRRRSRSGLAALTAFSLVWFGVLRRGCVCSVGALQNMVQAWAGYEEAVTLAVIVVFAVPLVVALFAGRVFCAAVCPLGAIQELTVWRPVKVPVRLNALLSVAPWIVLATAVLFAATDSGFLLCRTDPYVGFFRMGAPLPMLFLGLGVMLLGTFVARPYCRYVCPYGALMGLMSRLARRHVTISPSACVQCRLCENACPFGAIRKPMTAAPEPLERGARRLALILLAAPLALGAGAATGWLLGRSLSSENATVARVVEARDAARGDDATAFEPPSEDMVAAARFVQRQFAIGGAVAGGLLVLGALAKLFGLSIWRSRSDYEPDRALCFSCGRCFASCPVERRRLAERSHGGAAPGARPAREEAPA